MRRAISATLGTALVLASSTALAQEFGSSGTFAISAERVFGLPYYEKTDLEWDIPAPAPNDREVERTTFGLATGYAESPYTRPRFGVDYFVIDSLSLGGSLTFVTTDIDVDPGGGDNDYSLFLLSPRVGYAIPFGRVAGFWPRGGFTFTSEGGDGPDATELALTAEAMFWIAPAEGIAFLVGPTFDIGITGELDDDPVDADMRRFVFGIAVGLMGWL